MDFSKILRYADLTVGIKLHLLDLSLSGEHHDAIIHCPLNILFGIFTTTTIYRWQNPHPLLTLFPPSTWRLQAYRDPQIYKQLHIKPSHYSSFFLFSPPPSSPASSRLHLLQRYSKRQRFTDTLLYIPSISGYFLCYL